MPPRPRLRIQGWDPLVLLSQIVLLQTLHYLTLSVLLPLLLAVLTDSDYLEYLGGSATVGMVLDWRQMAGRRGGGMGEWGVGWEGPGTVGGGASEEWARLPDPRRGWVLGVGWLLVSCVDISYLYYIIRRPTFVLDFSVTLLFIHVILTSYYSHSIPLSLFFWIIMGACTAIMVIFAEQLCVRRELREGLGGLTEQEQRLRDEEDDHAERIEMGDVGLGVSID